MFMYKLWIISSQEISQQQFPFYYHNIFIFDLILIFAITLYSEITVTWYEWFEIMVWLKFSSQSSLFSLSNMQFKCNVSKCVES